MRLLVLALATALPAGSAAAPPAESGNVKIERLPGLKGASECRRADIHQADRRGPAQLRRLDELPPARGYMTVYRTIDGCEVPMTVVEYRQGLAR